MKSPPMNLPVVLSAVNLVLLLIVLVLVLLLAKPFGRRPGTTVLAASSGAGTCSSATCGASDPVSDPAYNMREIAAQIVLLEEHLTVRSKYCEDCIAKHFIHCIGLANEAAMLAGERAASYPLLQQTPTVLKENFQLWLDHRADPQVRLTVASQLRDLRKSLVQRYFTSSNAM